MAVKIKQGYVVTAVGGLIIILSAIVMDWLTDPVEIFGENYGIGTIVVYSLLLYSAASLRIVGPKEQGSVLLAGRPWFNVSSGLVIVPLLICWLVTETKLVIQDELPAEPEKIYRGSEKDPDGVSMPPELQAIGMRPPIRVTFSGRNAESKLEKIDKDDPYDRRLTEEVVPVIRWKIDNLTTFIQVIGSVDEARKQMEDTCVKTFTEHLTKVSPAVTLLRIERYSTELQKAIETLVSGWGVHIENAQIKALRFSKALNTAVQNVVVQERNKKASILEGEGTGGKEKAVLNGRTDGLAKMAKELDVKGNVVLGAETARAIAGEGDKSSQRTIIAGSGGFVDLVGTAAAIAKSFTDKGGA